MTVFHSLRARLTFWYAAMLLAGLLAFSGWIWFAVQRYLASSADDRITQRLQGLNAAIEEESLESFNALCEELREFALESPEGELTAVRGRGARIFFFPRVCPRTSFGLRQNRGSGDLRVGGFRYRAMRKRVATKGETYDLAVATSTAEADAFLAKFRWLLLGAAPMLAIFASFGGYWIRRALARVDQLTSAARRIGLENLGQRLSVSKTGDELERLEYTLTYVYRDSTAVLGPLAAYVEPHCYDLCAAHADRLTAPRGWDVVRLQAGPADEAETGADDLEALANAVREAVVPRAAAEPVGQGVEVGRRGHLRVLRSGPPD